MVVDIKNHIKMVHYKIRNFQCPQCQSSFTSNSQMMKHKEAVHTNLKVECGECGGMFKSTTLQSHVRRVHRGIKPAVPCTEPACKKVFGSKGDLERHVLGVHMKWKAPCPECGKKIRMETLMIHMKRAHRGIYKIKCQQCGQGFQNQKCLETHVRVKHQGTFLFCRASMKMKGGTECGKILLSEEGLINHVECKHMAGAASTLDICPKCSTEVRACYLLQHITSLHSDLGTVECVVKECGARLSDMDELRHHVATVHHTLGLQWCRECGQHVLHLGEHGKLQHEVELPFQPVYGVCAGRVCGWEGCTFMANSETHMARHVKNQHQKIQWVKCEQCGKKVKNLEEHVRVHHEKIKSLLCDLCDKLFLTKGKLNTHRKKHRKGKEICKDCGVAVKNMRQHTRFVHEKNLPFKCEEPGCETKFTSTCGLKKHIESVHQMLREQCLICQKSVSDVKQHIKIVHHKIREYQCPECCKYFQTKTHLKNHVAHVHLGLREDCPECGKMVQNVKNHINIVHNKVANFPCDQCSTKCLTSTALQKHVSSVHLKEKINCPECGIVVALAHLARHVQRKHSDKVKVKFTCTHCDKFFPDRGQLAKHIMRVHLEVRDKCSACGLMTKDLKRHNMYTNCGREGYVPRDTGDWNSKTELSGSLDIPEKCEVGVVRHEHFLRERKLRIENKETHEIRTTSDKSEKMPISVRRDLLIEHSVVINNNTGQV
eukprot:GFUD01029444.1.p1 GENE.GFUD01029444.1~~GFUD01029444.1.p1  ORF type:complete len:816 (+),score=160.55 GFUD01029444.1:309-2450(+)